MTTDLKKVLATYNSEMFQKVSEETKKKYLAAVLNEHYKFLITDEILHRPLGKIKNAH